jgi:hypothetical protein
MGACQKEQGCPLAAIAAGDASSPYYLYLQADIRLQWALVRLKFGETANAFTEVSKAYKLLRRNVQRFPDFMPNYKDMGVLHAMVGTIPEGYRWGIKLLSGLDGTIEQGCQELETVVAYAAKNDFVFANETAALYAYVLLHLANRSEEAWQTVIAARFRPQENLLHCFVMANVAMRTGRNDTAIRLLSQRPQGPEYKDFPYLDFMLGLAKLRRLDSDADKYFLRYLSRFGGQNFIKEAYQKLAWHALLNGKAQAYRQYMDACQRLGAEVVGGDKSAQKEAAGGLAPHRELLKARLLFDGAYFERAYRVLEKKNPQDFPIPRQQLEYAYRMGRILHGMKEYSKALFYYQRTIEVGRDAPYFFACNAALQSGLIYESLNSRAKAREYFNLCLAISPDEHRTGLHQQAKSGLARLRGMPN